MPRKNQIIKEVFRWRPAITLEIPHKNMKDNAYEGYWITKDSIVYWNIWNMHQDEGHYGRVEGFVLER